MTDIAQISFFGLGTLGSNMLLQLARSVPSKKFVGYDFDRVEQKNLSNQAFYREHIGLPKVKAMQVLLARLQGVSFTPIDRRIDQPLPRPPGGELWVDVFDNAESRALFPPGDHSIVHVGLSPDGAGEVIWNADYSVPGRIRASAPDVCTNPAMVAFTNVLVGVGVISILNFIQTGEKNSFLVRNPRSPVINKL